MFGFKRKHFVKVTEVGSQNILGQDENTQISNGTLEIMVHTTPDRAMGMTLAAMTDVAERFRRVHNAMPKPCDCGAIRFANVILRHVDQINDEMSQSIRELTHN